MTRVLPEPEAATLKSPLRSRKLPSASVPLPISAKRVLPETPVTVRAPATTLAQVLLT
jgi:hypothetical protein